MTSTLHTWVPGASGSPFSLHNLPYGVFSAGEEEPRVGVAIGGYVVDLAPMASIEAPDFASVFTAPSLNPFMALGPQAWRAVRQWVSERLSDPSYRDMVEPELVPLDQVRLHRPFDVADVVVYGGADDATGPSGRCGRAGSVVPSGTPVTRPSGPRSATPGASPVDGASEQLDVEAGIGFVVGAGSRLGERVPVEAYADHVFGAVAVADWCARDLHSGDTCGGGAAVATSLSPWVVPVEALRVAAVQAPTRRPAPLPYLEGPGDTALDLELELRLNGHVLSRPRTTDLPWTPAQLLAQTSAYGAPLRTGDLYVTGALSGTAPLTQGCLRDLTRGGDEPVSLPDGGVRTYLRDGDEVTVSASAPGPAGERIGFGEVTGRVVAHGG